MAIQTFKFDYDSDRATVIFKVDMNAINQDDINTTLSHNDWDTDIDDTNDALDVLMKKYALKAIKLSTTNLHTTKQVINDFKQNKRLVPVCGNSGITLEYISKVNYSEDLLERV